ncbi:major outer membrane protein [Aliarcobacter cryaerophilus]|uniref:major outer membrane protein n=1 Tax=Aliarcobacter cryaerophilus TaxID=28198 RepID=UPI003DA31CC4
MRKISKISLVAAVAVAGFSTANAQPLEEAIKNVDVSGSVVYRYNNYDNNGVTPRGAQTESNNYKVGLNLSSKVNDYVKFNSRFIIGGSDGGFVSLDSKKDNGTDANADVTLSNAYFGFTAIPNTVVNVGKQGLATPYTVAVDINGNEQTGTGILALSTFGPITAGAGYFNNTNINTGGNANANLGRWNTSLNTIAGGASNVADSYVNLDPLLNGGLDMYVATVQGDLDFVKLEAWYAGLQNTFGSYTLAATSNLDLAENAKLGLEARYVYLGLNDKIATGDDAKNAMFRFAVDGKFSIVNARLAYTNTDKHGGLTALDQDAKNTSLGWAITSNGIANADYFQAALGADILDNLNFTVHYGDLEAKDVALGELRNGNVIAGKLEQKEVYGQLTYKMSKNLNTYLRYGNFQEKFNGAKSVDQDMGRLQVAYTF